MLHHSLHFQRLDNILGYRYNQEMAFSLNFYLMKRPSIQGYQYISYARVLRGIMGKRKSPHFQRPSIKTLLELTHLQRWKGPAHRAWRIVSSQTETVKSAVDGTMQRSTLTSQKTVMSTFCLVLFLGYIPVIKETLVTKTKRKH